MISIYCYITIIFLDDKNSHNILQKQSKIHKKSTNYYIIIIKKISMLVYLLQEMVHNLITERCAPYAMSTECVFI